MSEPEYKTDTADVSNHLEQKHNLLEEETETPSQPAPVEPAPVEAMPELPPVDAVPQVSEVAPIEAVPAPVEFATPSGKSVKRRGSCAAHMKRKLDSVSRSNSFAAPPLVCPEASSSRKRVSLLAPPPADFLVTRRESSESWNRFLQDLDRILESRAEFV